MYVSLIVELKLLCDAHICSGIASTKAISQINVLGGVAHQSKDNDMRSDANDFEAGTDEARGIELEVLHHESIGKGP